jgi:hypothetical protein
MIIKTLKNMKMKSKILKNQIYYMMIISKFLQIKMLNSLTLIYVMMKIKLIKMK